VRASAKRYPDQQILDTGTHNSRITIGCCVLLFALVFVVFGRTATFGFLNFDDDRCVYANRTVSKGIDLHNAGWAFTHSVNDNWVPLTTLSHMLDCQIFGLQPGAHHLVNVAIHAIAVVLLFLLLRRMTGKLWPSAFVAAVFAVHPLRVESVAWIAERKDVLSGVFFMLTLLAYIRYCENKTWKRYVLTLASFAAGLLAKPMLVTVPMILLLLDWWPLGRLRTNGLRRCVLEKVPFLVLAAADAVATIIAQRDTRFAMESIPASARFANAAISYLVYLKQMVVPTDLAAFYPHSGIAIPVMTTLAAFAIVVGITAIAWVQRTRQPQIWFGSLWYLAMLLPAIGLVQVGGQAHADRYTYLPQIGVYIAITWTVVDAATKFGRRNILVPVAFVIVSILSAVAFSQTTYWNNSASLWAHTAACTETNAFTEANFAQALEETGNITEAMAHYRHAIELFPDSYTAHNNLGKLLAQRGSFTEAFEHYQAALRINPKAAKTYFNLGNLFDLRHKTAEAIACYQRSLQLAPDEPEVRYNLGNEFLNLGKFADAIPQFEAVLVDSPNNPLAHLNIGNAFSALGRTSEAKAHYQRAFELNPSEPLVQYNLGLTLLNERKPQEASIHFQQALELAIAQNKGNIVDAARTQLTALHH
jgi:tetratricopeptide (TPR) repeat protein